MKDLWRTHPWSLATIAVVSIFTYGFFKCIYNLYFHPLARYPGPRIAAVSNVWYAYHWLSGRYPWAIESVIREYGDVVRIGPNDLVFWTPKAYTDIYAHTTKSKSKFLKGRFQDIGEKELGITAERDPEKHRVARKLLSPGFSPKAVKAREHVIHTHTDRFVAQLRACGNTEHGVDMCKWSDWVAWDMAGDMSYGRQFDNIKNLFPHETLASFMKISVWATTLHLSLRFPLLRPFVFLLFPPSLTTLIPRLLRMNREEMRRRITQKDELSHPDLFQYLMPEDGKIEPDEEWLLSHANVLMVAGFDPHANLFSSIFYFLSKNRDKLQLAVEEIRKSFGSYDEISSDALQSLKYLQAVIDESLRIHTNAAFGLPRVCPEGAVVDGCVIPPGTTVSTAFFATTHSERYFKNPRGFHPERWLPKDHVYYDAQFSSDDKSAFHPFSLGTRGCPGEYASIVQAKIFVAKILWTFDLELRNENDIDWERDCRLYALWHKPQVLLRFRPTDAKTVSS